MHPPSRPQYLGYGMRGALRRVPRSGRGRGDRRHGRDQWVLETIVSVSVALIFVRVFGTLLGVW